LNPPSPPARTPRPNGRWLAAPAQPLLAERFGRELGVSPLLARCLINRQITDLAAAANFLEPRLRQLSDPFLLPDMRRAIDRLVAARARQEPLVIFGDYDVDGITSTALLCEVLTALGWTVSHYLPSRLEEGYGLSEDAVRHCLERCPARLLLAVDCGSTAVASIRWLQERGVDTIVLDHHQVSDPAPAACALVNPQRSPAPGLSRDLCSAGLAFKLAHALVKTGREQAWPAAAAYDLRPLLDLVALGTVADLVPLTGENRILAGAGLERLRRPARPGLRALKSVAQTPEVVGVYEVGFQLAPRLNAAGRLEAAASALAVLQTGDLAEAERLARDLDTQNRERQRIERAIAEEVIGALHARFNPDTDYVIVEGQMLWHIGVVGIVASRVLREFYRPALILGGTTAEWRGSGRSIEGFDLAAALRECDDLLLRHGGHAMAAGVSVKPENVDALRTRLNAIARRTLTPEQLQRPVRIDAEIRLEELTLESMDDLARLEPVGQGNPPAQFVVRNVSLPGRVQQIGKDGQHAKFRIQDGAATAEVIWWGGGDAALPTGRIDLAFAPQLNEYNDRRTVQLKLLDWRPASGGGTGLPPGAKV
jgi:single-stranded-DNA-specific exonuclease